MEKSKRQFREPDDATRAKMSAKKAGPLNPNYNQPRSTETKQLISDKLKEYWKTIPSRNNNLNKDEL